MARSLSTSSVIAVLAVLLLASCQDSGADSRKADLVLGDQAGLGRAKVEASGALAGSPYRFEWANFPGAAPLIEALSAGAVDTAPAGDTPVILAAAAGAPLRIVAASRSGSEDVAILVLSGSPIRSVKDLKRRNVIVSSARGSVAHYLLLRALEEAGIRPQDVTIGFMLPNDAAAAFAAARIDAWATFGTYQATAEHRGARVLRDGRGINSGIALITASEDTLSDPAKRRALTDYLARQASANAWSRDHPEDYAALYAKQTKVDPVVARTIARRQNPELIAADASVVNELQRVADEFYRYGVIPKPVQIAPLVDPSLFPVTKSAKVSRRNAVGDFPL